MWFLRGRLLCLVVVLAALCLGSVEAASGLAVEALTGFRASVSTPAGEEVSVEVEVDDGRPSSLSGMLWRRAGWWMGWIVNRSGLRSVTNCTTSITISVTGSNVEPVAVVDYYIKAVNRSGSPGTRTVEGYGVNVSVGGGALQDEVEQDISGLLSQLGLNTSRSQTIDYFVYVGVNASGAVSGEKLCMTIGDRMFDTVEYRYGSTAENSLTAVMDTYVEEGDLTPHDGENSAWFGTTGQTRQRTLLRFQLEGYEDILSDSVSLHLWHWQGSSQQSYAYTVYETTGFHRDVVWSSQPPVLTALASRTFLGKPAPGAWRTWSSPELGNHVSQCVGGNLSLGVKAENEVLLDTACRVTTEDKVKDRPYLSFTYVDYAAWYRLPPLSLGINRSLSRIPASTHIYTAAIAFIAIAVIASIAVTLRREEPDGMKVR